MKRKISKKLSLNKETVRLLNGQLSRVGGGRIVGSYDLCSTKEDLGTDCDHDNTQVSCGTCQLEY